MYAWSDWITKSRIRAINSFPFSLLPAVFHVLGEKAGVRFAPGDTHVPQVVIFCSSQLPGLAVGIIKALVDSGDRTAALAKMTEFAALLDAELGVAPTAGMLERNEKLISGETGAVRSQPVAKAPASAPGKLFRGRAAVAVLPYRCMSDTKSDV
ncbi:hypothetical protein [Candidatus Halocynthiibacter alkanivorans]|uniref:hypothetical protein n=1 Tax=Candidatus Halocynthiibacter alkanivorans TaxID=2267619 RepID=UPI00109C511C|nr:hypothetical protein [Candidatus Halocynthiibacter alkanivorans]